jgi:hypothetical protein
VEPHEWPSHVAAELAGATHGEQDAPQLSTLESLTQAPLQR